MCPCEKTLEYVPGLPRTAPCAFPFAALALYIFTAIHLSCEDKYMLNPVSPTRKSLNAGEVLGTPNSLARYKIYLSIMFIFCLHL